MFIYTLVRSIINLLQLPAHMECYDLLMELLTTKEELKFVLIMCGALYVITVGVQMMLKLSVDN